MNTYIAQAYTNRGQYESPFYVGTNLKMMIQHIRQLSEAHRQVHDSSVWIVWDETGTCVARGGLSPRGRIRTEPRNLQYFGRQRGIPEFAIEIGYRTTIKSGDTMNGAIDKTEMNVQDLRTAKFDLEKVLSKSQIIEMIHRLEKVLGGMVIHYESSGWHLEILYSHRLERIWKVKGTPGRKVRYIQRDAAGNIIEDMCKDGVLTSGETFFISCDLCVDVNFGNGSEAYDITKIKIID